MQLSHENAHKITKQNEALKAELRAAKQKIRELQRAAGRSTEIRPDQVEIELLSRLAECEIDDGFTVNFAAPLELTQSKLDYHLQRLVDGGFAEVLFTDSALGDNFSVTQRGRHALVKKHRL